MVFQSKLARCPNDNSSIFRKDVVARLGLCIKNYKITRAFIENDEYAIYHGEHVLLEKPVSIQILHPEFAADPDNVHRFLSGAQAASRIRHPNIIDVTDFGVGPDGLIFQVIEFIDGETLGERMTHSGCFDVFETVNIVHQIAKAMTAAHFERIVHQKLTPESIFLLRRPGRRKLIRETREQEKKRFIIENEGDFDFVKIIDLGVTKSMKNSIGKTQVKKATINRSPYSSPEQLDQGRIDERSNIFSLGVIFYQMLKGSVPAIAKSAEGDSGSDVSRAFDAISNNGKIDDHTKQTIERCLEVHPDRRFQSMSELCESLLDCYSDKIFLRHVYRFPEILEEATHQQNSKNTSLVHYFPPLAPEDGCLQNSSPLLRNEPLAPSLPYAPMKPVSSRPERTSKKIKPYAIKSADEVKQSSHPLRSAFEVWVITPKRLSIRIGILILAAIIFYGFTWLMSLEALEKEERRISSLFHGPQNIAVQVIKKRKASTNTRTKKQR